jgi:hypothetical protein
VEEFFLDSVCVPSMLKLQHWDRPEKNSKSICDGAMSVPNF